MKILSILLATLALLLGVACSSDNEESKSLVKQTYRDPIPALIEPTIKPTTTLMTPATTIPVPPLTATAPSELRPVDQIIDTHNHLLRRPPLSCDFASAVDIVTATMDRFGIQKMLIMPTPGLRENCDSKSLAEITAQYPDRFAFLAGGGTLNPMIHESVSSGELTLDTRTLFAQKAETILEDGAVGFGEITAEHFSFDKNHPYESAPPDHPLLLLLADIAAQNGVPIDLHMEIIPQDMEFNDISPMSQSRRSSNNPSKLQANLKSFEQFLDHNPDARIVWVHAGWDNTGFRSPELMGRLLKNHQNLYISIRPFPPQLPLPNKLFDDDGQIDAGWMSLILSYPDRMFIGLDTFFEPVEPYQFYATKNFFRQLPLDVARKISYENAIHVYNLG